MLLGRETHWPSSLRTWRSRDSLPLIIYIYLSLSLSLCSLHPFKLSANSLFVSLFISVLHSPFLSRSSPLSSSVSRSFTFPPASSLASALYSLSFPSHFCSFAFCLSFPPFFPGCEFYPKILSSLTFSKFELLIAIKSIRPVKKFRHGIGWAQAWQAVAWHERRKEAWAWSEDQFCQRVETRPKPGSALNCGTSARPGNFLHRGDMKEWRAWKGWHNRVALYW